MKKKSIFVVMAASAIALSGCGNDESLVSTDLNYTMETPAATEATKTNTMVFTAGYAGNQAISKTTISEEDSKKLMFQKGDIITIIAKKDGIDVDQDNSECKIADGANEAYVCTLEAKEMEGDQFLGIYPKMDNLAIPSNQTATDGSFDPKAHLMAALTSKADMNFEFTTKNTFIKFVAPVDLTEVVLNGNNNEDIAGECTIDQDLNLVKGSSLEKTITLSGNMKAGETYYISLFPVEFTQGFTLTFTDSKGGAKPYKVEKSASLKTNGVIKIKDLRSMFLPTLKTSQVKGYLDACTDSETTIIVSSEDYDQEALTNAIKESSVGVNIIISSGLQWIGWDANGIAGNDGFKECEKLLSIELPNTINYMNSNAFNNCANLKTVILSDNLTEIPPRMFMNCESLSKIKLPNSIKTIGSYAFSDCTSLSEIEIADELDRIMSGAFKKCTSLKHLKVICKKYETQFLEGSGIEELEIKVTDYGIHNSETIGDINSLKKITILEGAELLGGVTRSALPNLEEIIIPQSVTNLTQDFFSGSPLLKKITIYGTPDIGYSFFGSAPDNVTVYANKEIQAIIKERTSDKFILKDLE